LFFHTARRASGVIVTNPCGLQWLSPRPPTRSHVTCVGPNRRVVVACVGPDRRVAVNWVGPNRTVIVVTVVVDHTNHYFVSEPVLDCYQISLYYPEP
jgi:hypothetical protein